MTTLLKLILLVAITGVGFGCAHGDRWHRQAFAIEFIGEVIFPTGYQYNGIEVGGLSGIEYDPANNQYVAISDDQAQYGPVRFFELTIDLSDETLDPGDVVFTGMTKILDRNGDPIAPLTVDPESIRYTPTLDQFFWTSEGTALGAPFIRLMALQGHYEKEFAPPSKYLPGADTGVRPNSGFESLTFAADTRYLITATETALRQDGPATSLNSGSPVRVLLLNAQTGETLSEYIYVTEAIPDAPIPVDAFATNGLVELLTLQDSHLLALERAYSSGVGNRIRLFLTTTNRASDVRDLYSIAQKEIRPMRKRLLLDLDELDLKLDNIEGMTLGPRLADGSQTLILVSDNNFNTKEDQFTQFLAFKLKNPDPP